MHMCVFVQLLHCVFFMTPWTIVCQASLSMGFSQQEYWSGLLGPPPGDLPNPGAELMSHFVGKFFFFTTEPPGKSILNATKELLLIF